MITAKSKVADHLDRAHFVGGSDARVIMGGDETALIRLWQEKRGEAGPADLSDVLIVQMGVVTEDLNGLGTSASPAFAWSSVRNGNSTSRYLNGSNPRRGG